MTGSAGLEQGYRRLLAWYPRAFRRDSPPASSGSDLLGSPTPLHLTALFLPPVLFACGTVLAAVAPRPSRLLPS